jgi:hypothetical protein
MKTPYINNTPDGWNWGEVYPRPQFKRDSYLSLVGEWDFCFTDSFTLPSEYNETIRVPFAPESELSGIGRSVPDGSVLAYSRHITLPEGFVNDRVILHVGAADQECELYVNGRLILRHEGGYLPFFADVTDGIEENRLLVEILVRDTLSHKYPWGKQKKKRGGMWYTPVSGIWGEVWLESIPKDAIKSIRIDADEAHAIITADAPKGRMKLTLATGEVYEAEDGVFDIRPENGHVWTPDDPYIYDFTLESQTDRIESYFALRHIEIGEVNGVKRILLNGKPYFFTGLLDQGYFPDGIYTPYSPIAYRDDILFAKRLGFNMLRKHIKIEPAIFYSLCDRLGIAVFQDAVNNSDYSFIIDTALPTVGLKRKLFNLRHRSKETQSIFISQAREMQDHLYNCPSVLLYTVFNEGWGEFTPDRVYRELKERDPSRLYDATSGWFYGKESDFDSLHIYFRAPKLGKVGSRPIFLSEFGGYSLRCEGHLFGENNYGYKLFDSSEKLTDAVYYLFVKDTLPLIKDGLSATVYTQLSDVEDETNGLITYDRELVKVDADRIAKANEALILELGRVTE